MERYLELSALSHTWIIDLDGTILKHNGHKTVKGDEFVEGASEFLDSIPPNDMIIFLTSRDVQYQSLTERFLLDKGVRFSHIIYNAPYGERILINDDKPSGLCMAYALRKKRDEKIDITIKENSEL